ncbi:adenosylcobinamide-GDP ribazoletransferase [Oceanobacillus senegalensis]|uniref:adenosylcobinamide-GDP ribazoletransferase n=1 Tax=Oceanobacillus senegalensis TaxID=1936063 RepID=UPI000A30F6CA|nr:adenosylcobinamide-GDP ribazoletransferase [Oceanobacillus senegalensis]
MKFLKGFLINVQFFTSIPIRLSLPMDKVHIEKSILSFPLFGLFQGILYSLLFYALYEWTPFSMAAVAFLVWLWMIILTGGIHLDGWMDTNDAFFSFQEQDKRLEIMKDPRMGAFGVISIIILLSSRLFFLYEITTFICSLSYFLILFIPFLSKNVMGIVLLTIPTAKEEGMAAFFKNAARPKILWIYPIYIIILIGVMGSINGNLIYILLMLAITAMGCYLFIRCKVIKWFGGVTGDVLGATVEGTELILWMMVWLLHYFVMV